MKEAARLAQCSDFIERRRQFLAKRQLLSTRAILRAHRCLDETAARTDARKAAGARLSCGNCAKEAVGAMDHNLSAVESVRINRYGK